MTRDLIQQAVASMRHDRRRTALTMLGMAWGIATVVLLLAYGSGFARAINAIFEGFGTKVMGVFPGRTSMQAGGSKAGVEVRFRLEDVDRLQNSVPMLRGISPEVSKSSTVSSGARSFTWDVTGDLPVIQRIRNYEIDSGRFFNEEDNLQKARVVVLGSEAKAKLFSGQYALGEHVRINGISYEIIGVLKPKMQEGDNDINRVVFIPFNSAGDFVDTQYLGGMWLDYEGTEYMKIEDSIRKTLAASHGFRPDDRRAIFVFNAMKQVTQFGIITAGLKVLLAFIGTLTLGIGGIGLMNIMLVSVTQRTREIGVEKALGASRRQVLLQFLAEALVITGIGGVAGILLAYFVSWAVGSLTLYSAIARNAEAADIRLIIDPSTLLISAAILAVVGVISGMVPAIRAANLDPIEALRYE